MDGNDSAFPKLGMDGYGDSFPVGEMHNGETTWVEHRGGLTKREMFAAMAMQGIISAGWDSGDVRAHEGWRNELGREAVRYADALLEVL